MRDCCVGGDEILATAKPDGRLNIIVIYDGLNVS